LIGGDETRGVWNTLFGSFCAPMATVRAFALCELLRSQLR